jgi:hypothetical protein
MDHLHRSVDVVESIEQVQVEEIKKQLHASAIIMECHVHGLGTRKQTNEQIYKGK